MTNDILAQRIERLETENRRLKYAGLATVIATCALLASGATVDEPTTIETERFAIVVQGGETRARIGTTAEGYPTISLNDDKGDFGLFALQGKDEAVSLALSIGDSTERLSLGLGLSGKPFLRMCDGKERARLRLGIQEGESLGLELSDANDTNRASLILTPDQYPMFFFCDKDETPRLAMDLDDKRRPSIKLYDNKKDAMRSFFGIWEEDVAFLAIRGSDSKGVAEVQCQRNGDGFLRVLDKDEKTLFQGPDH